MTIALKKIKTENLDLIIELLKQNHLPYQDVKTENKEFFLAYDGSISIGIVGLENFGDIGLLRSMVVKPEHRSKKYGKQICEVLIDYAKTQGIKDIYLLTITAKDYFEKIGFNIIERDSAPYAIKNTTEFLDLCPSSAICMTTNI